MRGKQPSTRPVGSSRTGSQHGIVLVLGLLFLAIASILVISSMRTSSIQEKITSNHRNKTVSMMAAEYGANKLVQAIASNTSLPAANTEVAISGLGAGDATWKYTASGNIYTVTGRLLNGSTELAQTKIELRIPSIAGKKMQAGGNLTFVSSTLDLSGGDGDMYARGNLEALSGANVTITSSSPSDKLLHYSGSRSGPVNFTGNSMSVASKTIPNPWTSLETDVLPSGWPSSVPSGWRSCDLTNFSNAVAGDKFYCTGNYTFSSNVTLNGITLVVKANILFENAATITNSTILAGENIKFKGLLTSTGDSTRIYSGGYTSGNIDMEYSGTDEQKLAGEFYAGGSSNTINLKNNSKTTLTGSMSANGNIKIESQTFVFNATPTAGSANVIQSWRELKT